MGGRRIPYGIICYRCGKNAERRERDDKGVETGNYICGSCYWFNYTYGITYEKPQKSAKYYNKENICEFIEVDYRRCTEILSSGNARKFEIDGKIVWYCEIHGNRYRMRQLYEIGNRRTGNQDPNSNYAKGDRGEELLCRWKGYTNLNKKNNNYVSRIDCLDEKTGLYYQVSNDKKNIEMGYEIPEKEITRAKGINIVKNPTDRWGNSIIPKYEQYRISDNDMKFGIYFKRR